jgi:hypothetical protein
MVAMAEQFKGMQDAWLADARRRREAELRASAGTGQDDVELQRQLLGRWVEVPVIGELADRRLPVWIVVRGEHMGQGVELTVLAVRLTEQSVVVRKLGARRDEAAGGVRVVEFEPSQVVGLMAVERLATERDVGVLRMKYGSCVDAAANG